MKHYVPHYYKDFECIADKCKDSCCIGWEIDIDADTMEMYMETEGSLGQELRENITVSEDGSDCFRLTSDERCPFLDKNNLCRLILEGGEDMLCDICHLHPRFRSFLPDRCETGLGLCCEEAARLILTDDKPFSLICTDDDGEAAVCDNETDFCYHVRDHIFAQLDKNYEIPQITAYLLELGEVLDGRFARGNFSLLPQFTDADVHSPDHTACENIRLILSLEPLNDSWNDACRKLLRAVSSGMNFYYDKKEQTAYTNLLRYYVFRYFMEAAEDYSPYLKLAMAVFSADAVSYISLACGMSVIDAACLWSKETEYSAENMEMIYDHLSQYNDELSALNEEWNWHILFRYRVGTEYLYPADYLSQS